MTSQVANSQLMAGYDLPDTDRTWFGQRAKRTEAMPKNTLFGGDLEIYKDGDRQKIKNIDVEQFQKDVEKQRRAKQTRYHTTLPSYLRKRGPEDVCFEESKEAVNNQLKEHARAKKMLDLIETNSKFFNVGVKDDYQRPPSELAKPHQWYKQSDLKHSEDINIIGLEPPKNYNRDKYGKKTDSHQYALLGDPLGKGMDFADSMKDKTNSAPTNTFSRRRDPSWLPREAYMKPREKDPQMSDIPIDLPPNIQHQFGTKICRQVLSDMTKVNETLEQQARIRDCNNKTRRGDKNKFVLPSDNIDPVYEDLSHSVRQNMFPGFTFNHTISLNKTVYTEDVFKNRQKDPDEWRYHRDELSTWAEYNVLRDRMSKKWDEYNQNKPKLEANWDRNARRPDPLPVKPKEPPKAKSKAKAKQKQPTAKDSGFEEVVFKTPPLTPPPPSPPKSDKVAAQKAQRDDEFWDFYNKGH